MSKLSESEDKGISLFSFEGLIRQCQYDHKDNDCEKCSKNGHYCGPKMLAKQSKSGDSPQFGPTSSERDEKRLQLPWHREWLPIIFDSIPKDDGHSLGDVIQKLRTEIDRYIQAQGAEKAESPVVVKEDEDLNTRDLDDDMESIHDAGPLQDTSFEEFEDKPVSFTSPFHQNNLTYEPSWFDIQLSAGDPAPQESVSMEVPSLFGAPSLQIKPSEFYPPWATSPPPPQAQWPYPYSGGQPPDANPIRVGYGDFKDEGIYTVAPAVLFDTPPAPAPNHLHTMPCLPTSVGLGNEMRSPSHNVLP
jgi:hypothetical protein